MTTDEAEAVALRAVEFLAADEERIGRFLALTGAGPAELAAGVRDHAFLCGVLEHLLSDETLLFLFCDHALIAPEVPAAAQALLAGAGRAGAAP